MMALSHHHSVLYLALYGRARVLAQAVLKAGQLLSKSRGELVSDARLSSTLSHEIAVARPARQPGSAIPVQVWLLWPSLLEPGVRDPQADAVRE